MIKLYLFGGFRAEDHAGASIAFATNKTRALLAYLATTPGQEQARPFLADLLWPTSTEDVALSNLRNTLARVRKSVTTPAWLTATRQTIQLVAEPHELWTDVTAFDYLWEHLHVTTTVSPLQEDLATLSDDERARYRINWMREAAMLYQGEFLAGLFWDEDEHGAFWQWRRQKQEEYHTKTLFLLDQLADDAIATGDYAAATEYARRQLTLEPWREQAHRQFMLALAGQGNYSGALAQYVLCRQAVRDELGAEPEAETSALFQRIQTERQQVAASTDGQDARPNLRPDGHPNGMANTPAVVTPTKKRRHNLPAQLTPFIGRVSEVQQLSEALQASTYRLHVVAGMGGMGKSRLALHVARLQLEQAVDQHFDDGIFFVPLADVAAVDEVVSAIARALPLSIQDELPLHQQLFAYLQDRPLLLLLDNAEHLLDEGQPASSTFVTLLLALLHHAPKLVLLVTSRRQLNVRAENLFLLEGLAYPTQVGSASSSDLHTLRQYDAIHLFVKHAQRVNKQFLLADEAPAVIQICQLVEGLPLGIELAAAQAQERPCAAMLADLRYNLAHLQRDFHDMPPRQRSLLAVFDFSWGLLLVAQQALLTRCAIFQGGFTWADICALLPDAIQKNLDELVVHCLVQQQADGRYRLHALVQQCARQVWATSPIDSTDLAAKHSRYFLEKLHGWRTAFYSLELPVVLDGVAQDWANLHAAWQWALHNEKLAWLDGALDGFFAAYYYRRYHEEGINLWRSTAARLANHASEAPTDLQCRQRLYQRLQIKQARHLFTLTRDDELLVLISTILASDALAFDLEFETLLIQGWLDSGMNEALRLRLEALSPLVCDPHLLGEYWRLVAWHQGEHGNVAESYAASDQALAFYQSGMDYAGQTLAYRSRAKAAVHLNQLEEARRDLEAAMHLANQRQDLSAQGNLHEMLGMVYSRLGDHGAAIQLFTIALANYRQEGKARLAWFMQVNMALEDAFLGNYAQARQQYEVVLTTIDGESQVERHECCARLNVGLLYHTIGEQSAALAATERALTLARELGVAYLEGYALTNLGYIHSALGCLHEAEAAYTAALALRERLGEAVLVLETRAGLARLALSGGDLALALEWIAPILTHLESATLDGVEEPLRVYLTCYRILCAAGDQRATPLAVQMQTELQRQAALISDPDLRESFLTQVPYHRAIMAIAK